MSLLLTKEEDWRLAMIDENAELIQEIIDMLNATGPGRSYANHNNVVDLIEELIEMYDNAQDTLTNIRDLT